MRLIKILNKMMKPIKAIIIGAGDRGNAYSRYAIAHPYQLQIIGVAEIDDNKRRLFSEKFNIPEKNQFRSFEEIFSLPRFADAVFITTLDRAHYQPAVMALKKGYNILLEKPISHNPIEILKLARAAENSKQVIMVCHVLRYTTFFGTIKKILDSNEIGDIISIQHNENIGNIHFSHSFVRGNWSNSNTTSPIILAKSCHDMDLLLWFINSKIKKLSSFGSLSYFSSKYKPKNAPKRCIDGCPVEEECPYSAIKIYLGESPNWFRTVITTDASLNGRLKSIQEGPYGRCVFQCDNNVPDHQVVNLEFKNGVTVSFTLSALTSEISRTLKIMGTKAELRASTAKNEIEIKKFSTNNITKINVGTIEGFHYGGDTNIVKSFISAIRYKTNNKNLTSLQESIDSHLAAFAAEESRLTGKVIDFDSYIAELNKKL